MSTGLAANSQTLRERILSALDHFWCPLRADDELRPYLEGVWGQPVAADDLAQLMADERRAFDRGEPRPVWVCLGIWPDGRADPDRWARSDWPLWVRVVDPDGEQARSSIRTESRPVGTGCCGSCIARRVCPGIQGQTP